MPVLASLFALLRDLFLPHGRLVLENLALRQQLGVLRRQVKRPRLGNSDRLFWVVFARLVAGWRGCLLLLSPETVLDWQRKGFRAYWRRKCRHKMGRPLISRKLMCLIWRLQRENPTWGEKRIAAELALLGHQVGSSTVGRPPVTSGLPHTQADLTRSRLVPRILPTMPPTAQPTPRPETPPTASETTTFTVYRTDTREASTLPPVFSSPLD
jgi:hypothetical protein